jgi:hypothetical protein
MFLWVNRTTEFSDRQYQYGESLKAVFDKICRGAEIAYEANKFQPPLAVQNHSANYVCYQDSLYHNRDKFKLMAVVDIGNAGIIIAMNEPQNSLNESSQKKQKYFEGFAKELLDVIQKEKLRDEEGHPLSLAKAFSAYGLYEIRTLDFFAKSAVTQEKL